MDDTRFASLNELIEACDMGLDIEFFLYGVRYNISSRDYRPFICVCPDGDAVFYQDGSDLVMNHLIDGKPLSDLWRDIEIRAM